MLTGSLLLNVCFIAAFFYLIHRLGGVKFMMHRLQTNEVAGNYYHTKNQFDQLPISANDIVFLGNSLTAFGNWHEFFPERDIKNRGIAGDVTEGILKRLSPILDGKPKKIFLLIGVNDLLFHSPQKALGFYEQIVQKIRSESPETKLLLQSCLPINQKVKSMPITNEQILEINQGIVEIAEKQQLTYINLHPLFLDSKGRLDEKYTDDGIHLDANGYEIWKNYIEKWVME